MVLILYKEWHCRYMQCHFYLQTSGRSPLSSRGLLADRPRPIAVVRAIEVPAASAGLPEQTNLHLLGKGVSSDTAHEAIHMADLCAKFPYLCCLIELRMILQVQLSSRYLQALLRTILAVNHEPIAITGLQPFHSISLMKTLILPLPYRNGM